MMIFKKKHLIWGALTAVASAAVIFTASYLNAPVGYLTVDVNPSVRIVTNRLDNVVEVEPLNSDAKAMLDGYKLSSKNVDDVVEDLVDRMIFTGYITGGSDNKVLITVKNDYASEKLLNKVNESISDSLADRKADAKVAYQKLDITDKDIKTAQKNNISVGKMAVVNAVLDKTDRYTQKELINMSVKELMDVVQDCKAKVDFQYVDDVFAGIIYDKTSGNDYISASDAEKVALSKWSDAEVLKTELDDVNGILEYEVRLRRGYDRIDAEVSATTGLLKDWEVYTDYYTDAAMPSDDKLIGEEKAKKIASNEAVNSEVYAVELDREGGRIIYEVKLYSDKQKTEVEVDGLTGDVMKVKTKYLYTAVDDWNVEPMSAEKAENIALKEAPSGYKVIKTELDRDDGRLIYEIKLAEGLKEIDTEIHAVSGTILEWEIDYGLYKTGTGYNRYDKYDYSHDYDYNHDYDHDHDYNHDYDHDYDYSHDHNSYYDHDHGYDHDYDHEHNRHSSKNIISYDEARKIVLDKESGAYIEDIELDEDDGMLVYEIELKNGRMEIDAEVDAYSGKIIKWDTEYDD